MATTVLPPTAPTGAARRLPWRSPVDQPAYARPALLVIAAFAVLLYAWGIDHSQYHMFYANAARSMTESWKAFFFGSFDPGNAITLDKLPGFLWPQALSARIFGFHPWALTLPQVIEGVASVLVLYRVVRRWAGVNAALLSCGAFLLTPVAAGLFRTAVEDPAFTLCVLLAADATQRAAQSGRLRPLILAGVWVGVGFQAKMLEAWAVLPALALVYVISAPHALRKRLAHIGLAALVMAAVSASWMLAVTLTPAKDRPYIDGTTNNSAFSMVVGYNFLNRFSSLGISAASTGSVSATQGGGHGGAGGQHTGGAMQGAGAGRAGAFGMNGPTGTNATTGAFHRRGAGAPGSAFGAGAGASGANAMGAGARGAVTGAGRGGMGGFGSDQQGWGKMFASSLASQTGWLYPLAAVAIACGLLWRRGKPRTDKIRAGFVLWGTWLATYFLVFSAGSVGGHTYYMGVIAVPLAALAGGGITLMWRAYRDSGSAARSSSTEGGDGRRVARRAWALPAAVGATAVWSAYVSLQFPSFLPWLAPATIVLGLAAFVLLALARPGARLATRSRIALAGLLAGLCAILVAPGAWAVQVFNPAYSNSMMGAVGPSATGGHGGGRMGAGGHAAGGPWAAAMGGGAQRGSRGAGRAGGGMGGFGGASSGKLTAQQQRLLDYAQAHRGKAEYVFATTSWSGSSPYILGAGADVLPLGGFTGQVPFPSLTQFQQMVRSGKLQYVLLGGSRGMGAMFGGNSSAGTTTRITNWVKSDCAVVPAGYYGGSSHASANQAQAQAWAAAGGGSPSAADSATAQTLYQCSPTH